MQVHWVYKDLMSIPSLLRLEEHRALSEITLSGMVLDLGGDKNSEYLRFFSGRFDTTTLNFSEKARPDILHDLETPLPIANNEYDHVLLINVLEHIFEYRSLLQEVTRVVKSGGNIIIVVPFLFPVHPSPDDFHRFTASTLKKELSKGGFDDISVKSLGGGVFASRYVLLDRLLPKAIRVLNFYTLRYCVTILDILIEFFARRFHKKYNKADYALGFCATARKI